jgi:glycosyltransferase involved in cell wall biosynthesis
MSTGAFSMTKGENGMEGTNDNAGPLVSVLVGCYNHARFAEQCLEGVRNQTYRNWELIIFDDCSTDNSVEVIQKWIDRNGVKCVLVRHAQNVGLCRSVNEVIQLTRGKYIAGIATDDVWTADKLETQVAMFEKLPEKVGVVYSDAYQMDEQGNPLPQMFIEGHRKMEKFPEGNVHEMLWQGNFIPAMATMISRKCYDEVGLYDENLAFEDWDMWLRISEKFEFAFSSSPSAHYRIVGSSMMRTRIDGIHDSVARIYIKHLEAGKLEGARREKAVKLLTGKALELYRSEDPKSHEWLGRAVRYQKSPKLITAYLLSLAGVSSRVIKRRRAVEGGRKEQ